jgi:hypothetical protein
MDHSKAASAIISAVECSRICSETLTYLNTSGIQADEELHNLLKDCAKICDLAADSMDRESEMHSKICALCAEICDRCADACERASTDEQLLACAQACRDCAENCRGMSKFMDRLTT